MKRCLLVTAASIAVAMSAPVAAQDAATREAHGEAIRQAQALLEQCATATAKDDAKRLADEAERQFRVLLASGARTAETRVGLAQVLIRCQLQHTSMTAIMTVVAEAERELQTVLAAEPEHWTARFTLAQLLRNLPAMFGRGADAVREFERLLAQQGSRVDGPHYALSFMHLGDLHESAGRRSAAVAVWRRGLALFPEHPELMARLAAAGGDATPDLDWLARMAQTTSPTSDVSAAAVPAVSAAAVTASAATASAATASAATASAATASAVTASAATTSAATATAATASAVIAFAPLRVEALNQQFQETRAGTTLRRLDVYTMPGGTGEVLQALQALPGVTRVGDGAELHIRGGDAAETPVFFDGGRLAFPGRWESLQGAAMGVVDAAVLRRVYFSSGGFSARYGNALSGIVDVETEGRPAQASQRVALSMVQAGGSVRARAGERAGAWGTLSATDTRLVARLTGEAASYTLAPQSVQGSGAVTFEPLAGVELRATALAVGDRFGRTVELNGHHGAFESWSALQHVALSGRALRADARRGVSANVTASRRVGAMSFGVLDREREDRAVGWRLDADAVTAAAVRVRAGAEVLHYDAVSSGTVPTSPELAPGSPSLTVGRTTESAWHAGLYLEAEHEPLPGLAVVAGIRTDALPGESGAVVDPRIAAAFASGAWTVRVAAGVFHQGSWRARYRLPDPGQPSGTPRRAEHLVAGAERAGRLSLRIEAYMKRYDDYASAGAAAAGVAGPASVAGTSRGLDAIARWSPRSGPAGWASYSLLRGTVELENGARVPSALDVTHSLTSVVRVPVGAGWELGATARYATGKPYTPRLPGSEPGYGAVHSERVPDYQRLDGRLTRYVFGQDRRLAVIYLEMLNLLDRRNVMSYTYPADGARPVPVHTVFARRTFVLGVELQLN
jgi:vitamin B12 transporter